MLTKIYTIIIGFLLFPFYLLTRRFYLVSGTFIDTKGERMFSRTIFETSFWRFPIAELEKQMGQECGSLTGKVLVTSVQRIPFWMAEAWEKSINGDDGDSLILKK